VWAILVKTGGDGIVLLEHNQECGERARIVIAVAEVSTSLRIKPGKPLEPA
jgi:hypothetical protein